MSPLKTFVLSMTMLVASMLVPAVGVGQIPYPDEFIGVWEYTGTTRDCVTQTILGLPAGRDTVCAGDAYDPSFGLYEVTCSGDVTATTVDLQCTGSFLKGTDCTVDLQYDIDGIRNGDTFSTTTTLQMTFVGSGCPIAEFCTVTTSTGTRIDPNPDCTPAPVEAVSWGRIKHQYDD